jgi:hypothetical protein
MNRNEAYKALEDGWHVAPKGWLDQGLGSFHLDKDGNVLNEKGEVQTALLMADCFSLHEEWVAIIEIEVSDVESLRAFEKAEDPAIESVMAEQEKSKEAPVPKEPELSGTVKLLPITYNEAEGPMYMKAKEVCEHVHKSSGWVYALVKDGTLQGYDTPSGVLYVRSFDVFKRLGVIDGDYSILRKGVPLTIGLTREQFNEGDYVSAQVLQKMYDKYPTWTSDLRAEARLVGYKIEREKYLYFMKDDVAAYFDKYGEPKRREGYEV